MLRLLRYDGSCRTGSAAFALGRSVRPQTQVETHHQQAEHEHTKSNQIDGAIVQGVQRSLMGGTSDAWTPANRQEASRLQSMQAA